MNGISVCNNGLEDGFFERVRSIVLRKAKDLYGPCEGEGYRIILQKSDDLAENAYRITSTEDGVRVEASTRLGIISGAGRVLQEGDFDGGSFIPGDFSGTFTPRSPLCGVYFASHFGNYYVNAPKEEIIRYLEELALWGSEMIRVWFDFHHYSGLDDPDAQDFLARLELIVSTGKYLGMKIGYIGLANEGYNTTPDSVRAEWQAQNGYHMQPYGHYHTEICPNKKGGMALIIKNRMEFLDRFKDYPTSMLAMAVYDQGGCTCKKCAPWAANGYIKVQKELIPLIKSRFPDCKFGFSVWYVDRFIDGEWDKVYKAFEEDDFLKENIDLIAGVNANSLPKNPEYAEQLKNGIGPGNKPSLGFTEISMYGCDPWGGFGGNPYPAHLQEDWDTLGHLQMGMVCYSEGRFEDVNKYITLGLYLGRYKTADEAMLGYIKSELSKKYADDIAKLFRLLEETLPRDCEGQELQDPDKIRFVIRKPENITKAAALAEDIDAKLPSRIRNGWRWRMIYLRAMGDQALLESDFYLTEKTDRYLKELEESYYVDNSTYRHVSPVTRDCLKRFSAGQNE